MGLLEKQTGTTLLPPSWSSELTLLRPDPTASQCRLRRASARLDCIDISGSPLFSAHSARPKLGRSRSVGQIGDMDRLQSSQRLSEQHVSGCPSHLAHTFPIWAKLGPRFCEVWLGSGHTGPDSGQLSPSLVELGPSLGQTRQWVTISGRLWPRTDQRVVQTWTHACHTIDRLASKQRPNAFRVIRRVGVVLGFVAISRATRPNDRPFRAA